MSSVEFHVLQGILDATRDTHHTLLFIQWGIYGLMVLMVGCTLMNMMRER